MSLLSVVKYMQQTSISNFRCNATKLHGLWIISRGETQYLLSPSSPCPQQTITLSEAVTSHAAVRTPTGGSAETQEEQDESAECQNDRFASRRDLNETRPQRRLAAIPFPFAWTAGAFFTAAVQHVILSKTHGVGRHFDRGWICQILAAKLPSVVCTCRLAS